MGVYIKGMEMPTSCYMCDFCADFVQEDGIETFGCRRLKRAVPFRAGFRFDECPLAPVPPHGRLIDGDYLKHTHCAECTLYPDKCLEKTEDGCDWGSIIHLRMCPTIIPAEEGE